MISKKTIAQLQADERQVHFILGARLRNVKEIYETVLSRGGRYRAVHEARQKSTDPSPLKVKEVRVHDRLALGGDKFEWAEIIRDLEALQYVEVEHQGKRFRLRSEAQGTCSAVFRAAGVAIPATIERIS